MILEAKALLYGLWHEGGGGADLGGVALGLGGHAGGHLGAGHGGGLQQLIVQLLGVQLLQDLPRFVSLSELFNRDCVHNMKRIQFD